MALYPERIVLKNSTDGDTAVKTQIQSGGSSEIVPGEIVVSRRPGGANLFTTDSAGNIVQVGAPNNSQASAPRIFLDFTGVDNTPFSQTFAIGGGVSSKGGIDAGAGPFGGPALFSKVDHSLLVSAEDGGLSFGFLPWTVELWIKSDITNWPVDPDEVEPVATHAIVMGQQNYYVGPGASTFYLDGGTPDLNGTGTSTSYTSGMAKGAFVMGLGPGESQTFNDPLIPATGEIITTRNVSVVDNQWHHVVFQHEGAGVYSSFVDGLLADRVVLNGAVDHSQVGAQTLSLPTGFVIGLGQEDYNPSDPTAQFDHHPEFEGFIDSLGIWQGVAKYSGQHEYDLPTASVANELVKQPVNNLTNLFDTNIPDVIANGSVLIYDSVNGYWETAPAPSHNISGNDLGDIGDVVLQANNLIADGAVISWDASSQEWKDASVQLEDTNLDVSNLLPGQTIFYDGVGLWRTRLIDYSDVDNRPENLSDLVNDLTIDVYSLTELGDVDVTTPTNGQVLVYDGPNNLWKNQSQPPANIAANLLSDLSDVLTYSGATDNQYLRYNAQFGDWSASTIQYSQISGGPANLSDLTNDLNFLEGLGSSSIGDLQDVTTATEQEGQILIWRTDKWVNEFGPPANIAFSRIGELADVTSTFNPSTSTVAGALTFQNHGTISLDDPLAANNIRYDLVYDHPSASIGLEAIRGSDETGTHIRASRGGGVDLRSDINFFRLRGKPDTTTNRPQIRFETGDSFATPATGEYIGFSLPAQVNETVMYYFPEEDGDLGDVLATDGSGQLSWISRNANNTLGLLDDVDLATQVPVQNSALVYNAAAALWVPGTVSNVDLATSSIGDLQDVDLTTTPPVDGSALVYDGAANAWVPGDAASTLADLTDVSATAPTDGQALVYDNAAGEWVPGDVASDFFALSNLPTAISGGTFGSG